MANEDPLITETNRVKQKFKWGCLFWLGIFAAATLFLAFVFIDLDTLLSYSYILALLIRIVLMIYLSWLTLPAAVISLLLNKQKYQKIPHCDRRLHFSKSIGESRSKWSRSRCMGISPMAFPGRCDSGLFMGDWLSLSRLLVDNGI